MSTHTFSYTSYTPFHQTLHPYTLYKYSLLTTISLIFSILKTPKPISKLNHLLLFHFLSSFFHKHKTFHFFPNPSRINFFPIPSSLLVFFYFHLLSFTYSSTSFKNFYQYAKDKSIFIQETTH